MYVGKSLPRVDAYDKVTGRARYTEDLCDKNALVIKLCRSTIAHGYVKAIDRSRAEAIPGVVRIFTCFDVPAQKFPTAGHPWSTDPHHQDKADRNLLNTHVRYYGDEIAAVVAENDIAAEQAVRALEAEYEVLPFVLDPLKAMEEGAPQLHAEDGIEHNILAQSSFSKGNFEEAIQEPGLLRFEGWYETPIVQHCHIENHICYSYEEAGKQVVVSSTQIPHIVRRVVGQALGLSWGQIRIVKPYIGGGFGNKQDALYEPLVAWISRQLGGRLVKYDMTREETFACTRVRHSIKYHLISYVRPDGTFAARWMEGFSNQGAYASHGHSIVAKSQSGFSQLYQADAIEAKVYTVYTNTATAGAMRGYGMPQISFAMESHMEEIAHGLHMDPWELRKKNLMPVGFTDGFSKNVNFYPSHEMCMEKAMEAIHFKEKKALYEQETGPVRHGLGIAVFWYNTAVWPISLETSSCRMVLNQDGSIQLQLGETEIGQGADTAFAQMAADSVGIPFEKVHVLSNQDTDVTPFGTGAYASRQTYVGGFSIKQTGLELKKKILNHASALTRMPVYSLDVVDGSIVRTTDGQVLMTLGELATEVLYSMEHNEYMTSESTYTIRTNAYSFGAAVAEVEVDIPLCKYKLLNIINVHDCGKLINPALAEAQVHGGMSMGIGYAIGEQLLYDEKTGRPLNNNLLDYKLCTMMDHPDLMAGFVQNPEPTSPFGTKALGEPPVCPVAPAIHNAIMDATGVSLRKLPMNPHQLYARFHEEGLL